MTLSKKSGTRNVDIERYWRGMLRQWAESGKSQAAFCRDEGLNPNTFSSWKSIVPVRDLEASSQSRKPREVSAASPQKSGDDAPAFMRFSLADAEMSFDTESGTKGATCMASHQSNQAPTIAAELVDAVSGRRLRIFNGADQSTVSALVSALGSFNQ